MPSREEFRISARRKIKGAEILLGKKNLCAEVSYLCMIAMECALKRKLLSKYSFRRSEEINEDHQIANYFKSSLGHKIQILSKKVDIRKKIDKHIEKRIFSENRPYSLRYGSENVNDNDCQKEFKYAKSLVDELEQEQ
jgi:hypothetical protein